jgi:hypothetical protein
MTAIVEFNLLTREQTIILPFTYFTTLTNSATYTKSIEITI